MTAALLAEMLTQQLPGSQIEQTNVQAVPLHAHEAADPARRCAVIGGFDLDASVQMDGSLAVLVIAKRFQRQGQQRGFLFGEHGSHLTFGAAVDALIGPALFPTIKMGLRFGEALEALPFQWRLLGIPDTRFHFALSIRILNPARHGDSAVVSQHVTIERIQTRIVDIGQEYAFLQVVEHHDFGRTTQSTEGLFVQFGPDAGAGMEAQKTDALAAEAERQNEKARTPVLARLRVADHGAGTVINLRFFVMVRVP